MAAQQTAAPAPAAQPSSATSSSTPTPQASPANTPASPPAINANALEMSSREETSTTFKVKVNLVETRVVVRDLQGHVIGNLKREDFQLTDNGKPQVITKFSMEQLGAKPATKPTSSEEPLDDDATVKLPLRYVIFLFDDIHLQVADLAHVRDAVKLNMGSLESTERVAILTTSGQTQLDFTDDRDKIQDTLSRLRPRPITGSGGQECPDVSYYLADQAGNKNDPQANRLITQETLDCLFNGDPTQSAGAQQMAQSAIMRQLDLGNHETQISLSSLKSAVQRIAAMPGQRSIILLSSGFYNPDQLQAQTEIADRALHSGVVISALDARGLYTLTPDISAQAPDPIITGPLMQYVHQEATANADVMMELANATGGTFVQNSNDFEGGLRRLATPPEYTYLLAFAPQDLKLDGRFHNLKVTVKGQKLNIQARKGYYAPRQATDAAEQAKEQIRDEVFSQEELHDLPVELHTQFFKTSDDDAKLSVLVRLDVRHLHYRKVDGRNNNSVTVTAVVFDRNGNYVNGNQKTIEMHWKDETLGSKLASGVTLKSSFDVKPGSYMVRLVVRDEEGQLTAQNGAIEIP
jgi:VWFA-related protein